MSESSPFRTSNNNKYRWPPEPFTGSIREYERVTQEISAGEPQDWMRHYVSSRIVDFLVTNSGAILQYLVVAYNEDAGQFSLDQNWWNQQLDNAHQLDLNQALKREQWDNGELPHLKTRPAKPFKVAALLKLTPPQKFTKYLKAAPDVHRDNAAERGTTVHKIAEDLASGIEFPWTEPGLEGYRDAAKSFNRIYQPEYVEIESVVYSDTYGYAGQFDFLAKIPVSVMQSKLVWDKAVKQFVPWTDKRTPERIAQSPDYIWVWGDYKTGDKGIKNNIALQLSAYYYADYLGRIDGTKDPIPEVDEFWGVSIRDGALDVVPVTVNDETFKAFLSVRDVGKWMKQLRPTVLNKPLQEIA